MNDNENGNGSNGSTGRRSAALVGGRRFHDHASRSLFHSGSTFEFCPFSFAVLQVAVCMVTVRSSLVAFFCSTRLCFMFVAFSFVVDLVVGKLLS